jgi:hypothetical protein
MKEISLPVRGTAFLFLLSSTVSLHKQPRRYAELYYRMDQIFCSILGDTSRIAPLYTWLHICSSIRGEVPVTCNVLMHCRNCFSYLIAFLCTSERSRVLCEASPPSPKYPVTGHYLNQLSPQESYQPSWILSSVYPAAFGPTVSVEAFLLFLISIQLTTMFYLALW